MSYTPLRQPFQCPPSPSRSSDDETAQETSGGHGGEELASLTPILPKPYPPRSSTTARHLHRMEWDKENYDPHSQSFLNDPPFSSHGPGSSSKSPLSDITRSQVRLHTPSSLQSSHVYAQDSSDLLLQKASFSFSIYDESSSLSFPHLMDEPPATTAAASSLSHAAMDLTSREETTNLPIDIDACSDVQISEQDYLLSLEQQVSNAPTVTGVHPHSFCSNDDSERELASKVERKKGKSFTFFR